jgi:pimeloyl-ACP methyl ester carboxylesterase/DNA-binding CsgD family transcriptional regulator
VRLPQIRYARSGDFRIAYQVMGQAALDLVLVPGFLSNLDAHWEEPGYAHLMRRLSSFARLIHFDKRGTGLSDRVDPARLPTLEVRADDIRAVMEATGCGRAALLGASEGAPLALFFAATFPDRVRALVLYGGYASFHRSVAGPEAVERFIAEAERSWGTGASLRHFAPGRVNDPHFAAWWARLERLSASPTAAIALARMNAGVDLRGILGSIDVPTLVIHRRDDARVDPEAGRALARHIPGARLVELPGRDHPLWTGDTDAAVDAIEEFLTGMPAHAEPRRMLAALLAARAASPEPGRLAGRFWQESLEGFGGAVEETVRRHGGTLLRGEAGSWLARFDGAARAGDCAVALRAAAAGARLPLAQGLHVGEITPEAAAGGVAALTAEAVAAKARAGEILATALVAELAAGSGLHFAEQGTLAVEGVERPVGLAALVAERHLDPAARPAAGADLGRLSAREREVLELVSEGLSNARIAARLGLSEHTAKRHVANILLKLDLPTRVAAAALRARQPPA